MIERVADRMIGFIIGVMLVNFFCRVLHAIISSKRSAELLVGIVMFNVQIFLCSLFVLYFFDDFNALAIFGIVFISLLGAGTQSVVYEMDGNYSIIESALVAILLSSWFWIIVGSILYYIG